MNLILATGTPEYRRGVFIISNGIQVSPERGPVQYQSKYDRQHQEQRYGERNDRPKYFSLSEIRKRFGVAAGCLIAKETIGNPTIKSIGTQRHYQCRQFDP